MILKSLIEKRKENRKSLSVLIDPDKIDFQHSLDSLIDLGNRHKIDYFLIGGSLLISDALGEVVSQIKNTSDIPAVLFPGSNLHIDKQADAILFLSLISGRNAELLIGQHVSAAPILRQTDLEILPTGYILVGDEAITTVAYISQTLPIPMAKAEIAVCTAMAGEMLGMRLIYLDAGSGARQEVPKEMISQVRSSIAVPLIVGGGINTSQKAETAYEAGADMIVLGTVIEKNMPFLDEVIKIRDRFNG
jgi:putative glycerol-1-phosphate prenyltransferase